MKILLVEDDLSTCRAFSPILSRWGYEVALAHDGAAALQLLQGEEAPTLVLLDRQLPHVDGLDVCRAVRQTRGLYCYIIVLTGLGAKADVLTGLEAGADDYLVKPVDLDELRVRLGTARRILALQEQLVASREALRYEATHDCLTGMWNRRAILASLGREVERTRRERAPVGILLGDIDHFKRINDTYGHLTGDAVLTELAARMHHALRPYDLLGRYGGEEFLVVLPGCDLADTLGVGERLRAVAAEHPFVFGGSAIPLTVSLGAACATEESAVNDVIQMADAALYQAKGAGRNRVVSSPAPGCHSRLVS